MKRIGAHSRVLRPETGRALNKVLSVFDFATHADREKFWNDLPDDAKALIAKRADIYDVSAAEHYYYDVVE